LHGLGRGRTGDITDSQYIQAAYDAMLAPWERTLERSGSMGCEIDGVTLQASIRSFLREVFLQDARADVGDDASLLEEGIVDSTGVLELVAHLEETYGIEVKDEEIVPENFDTVRSLCTYVQRKLDR
jgi:acyl carrier protein